MQLDRYVVDQQMFMNDGIKNQKPYMLVFKDNSGKMWRFEPVDQSTLELQDFFDKQF